MTNISELLNLASGRAREKGLPYAGAVTPAEAFELLAAGARLVDVRTRPEWEYVGRIADSVLVEWQTYPGGRPNADFVAQLNAAVNVDDVVMFLCRSGVRSHAAATAAAQAGFAKAYNILEGFEGDKDEHGHRSTVGGWRAAGLPWIQG